MNRPYQPEEDAALLPYVARPCEWDKVMPKLPDRLRGSAQQRLARLRRQAGTLWRIEPRRERGRFA